MDDQTVQRILSAHADALNQGVDNSAWLLKQFCNGDQRQNEELEALLKLARDLKIVLVPVENRKEFVRALQAKLLAEKLSTVDLEQPNWSWRSWWGAAAIGSLAAGLGFIVWRRSRPNDQIIKTA